MELPPLATSAFLITEAGSFYSRSFSGFEAICILREPRQSNQRASMSQIPLWFERKFDFSFPPEHYPNICTRLAGAPARMEELLAGIPRDVLVARPEQKWSSQEHAGHLL